MPYTLLSFPIVFPFTFYVDNIDLLEQSHSDESQAGLVWRDYNNTHIYLGAYIQRSDVLFLSLLDQRDDLTVALLLNGLLELRPALVGSAAYFTEADLAALRLLAQGHRALNPMEYGHVRQQLGLDPVPAEPPGYPQNLG